MVGLLFARDGYEFRKSLRSVSIALGLLITPFGAAHAQSWQTLATENFETGAASVSTTPATQMAPGTTDYLPYTVTGFMQDGYYAIAKDPDFLDNSGGEHWQHAGDHTTGSAYMAIFNANPARTGVVNGTYYDYVTSVSNYAGATYRVQFWTANVLRYNYDLAGSYNAYIGLSVRDPMGGTEYALAPWSGTALARAVGSQTYLPWEQRSLQFQLPTTYTGSSLSFNFFNSAPGTVTTNGNDVAIDDLVFEMAYSGLSGKIFIDANADGIYNTAQGDSLYSGTQLYVVAVDANGKVVDTATVAANGDYLLDGVLWSTTDIGQRLILTTSNPAVGTTLSSPTIPSSYFNISQNAPAGYGNTGPSVTDGIINVGRTDASSTTLVNFNFGLGRIVPVTESGSAVSGTASTAITNVAANDTVNGVAATLGAGGNATVAQSGIWPTGIALDTATGAINVAANTAPGTYNVTYQLCDKNSPANCNTVTDTITVAAAITPVADSGTVQGHVASTAIANVAANDTVNGATATLGAGGNATVAQSGIWPAGITLDTATGAINVAANVPAGTYNVTYQLCDKNNPVNCATMTDTVTVQPVADLDIVKTNNTTTVTSGGTTTYTLTVTNNGPDTITGALIKDTPGSGLTCPAGNAVTITGSGVPGGSYTIADLTGAGIILGTLAMGQSTTLTYTCQVN